MTSLRVVFIGGQTNGRIVLEYLTVNRHVSIPLVITHPREMVLPRNVDLSPVVKQSKIIYDANADKFLSEIRDLQPDMIFVAGWSFLLSKELISIPRNGTIGFHPSKLPQDRGRSVLAWQMEEGYTETALTMFYYNPWPDCGDIIAQERIGIEPNDYIGDVLEKVDEATYNLMHAYYPLLRKGVALRRPQNPAEGSFRRLRTDRDSRINWDRNVRVIYNKIRAISRPYPGAFFEHNGQRITVWRSDPVPRYHEEDFLHSRPGQILKCLRPLEYLIRCREGILRIETDQAIPDMRESRS